MYLDDPRERESMLIQRIKAEMALVMWRAIPTKPSPSCMSCVPAYLDMDNTFAFLSSPFVSVCAFQSMNMALGTTIRSILKRSTQRCCSCFGKRSHISTY